MNRLRKTLLVAGCLLSFAACASGGHPRLLVTESEVEANTDAWQDSALFAAAVASRQARIDAYFATPPDVPVPVDAGGGYTHEQHKANSVAIIDAGMLYLWTGEARYARYAADLLEAYAAMYPGLGEHPNKKEQTPGRLFWQSLNESVFLVYVIQAYDAIYDSLDPEQRETIEQGLLRPLADFLSAGQPKTFNKIHNHGTWAVAAVGMTGYVLDDRRYVEQALLGLERDGSGGFLRQLDELFSPDGYYTEGPYYQRYALMPFVVFGKSIDENEPQRKIFEHRDGVLLKAIYTTIQLSYAGRFFPINDAIKDKGVDTVELDYAIPIAFGLTGDNMLLSLVDERSSLVLTGDGLALAQARDAGLAEPFVFKSMQLRDGANGDRGALSILRDGHAPGHTAVVFKATAQGLGHGHFDRLHWIYYDNGSEVVPDYGAARFLNVVQKNGGHYLPENKTWAKQTVAHNTLVVDETSHFDGKLDPAEAASPDLHYIDIGDGIQVVSAREASAYADVVLERTMALVNVDTLDQPLLIDVLRAHSDNPHRYDLPLYYTGQMTATSAPLEAGTKTLSAVGEANGYQHLWQLARGEVGPGERYAYTWILGNRFYTYHVLADRPVEVLVTEVGAGDPELNLRHESGLMFRTAAPTGVTFVNVMEAHGEYNGAREYTRRSGSQVADVERFGSDGKDVVQVTTADGTKIRLALSWDPGEKARHEVNTPSGAMRWSGFYRLEVE